MSLSFVSSSILKSSDGVSHDQEEEVQSREVNALRANASSSGASLFDQLRDNQQRAEEEEQQFKHDQRLATIGSLSAEDVDYVNQMTVQQQNQRKRKETALQQEIELFRLAQEQRKTTSQIIEQEGEHNDGDDNDDTLKETEQKDRKIPDTREETPLAAPPSPATQVMPRFITKKRKRRDDQEAERVQAKEKNIQEPTHPKENGNLGSLLGGYGSSSSEDDDNKTD